MPSARHLALPRSEERKADRSDGWYRSLRMFPAVYRLWARMMLAHMKRWTDSWQEDEMYAGVPGRGAEEA